MKIDDVVYRYVDRTCYFDEHTGKWTARDPEQTQYYIVKLTQCGYWVESRSYPRVRKWINDSAERRFAYPTPESAMRSYRIRKHFQVAHCVNALDRARALLARVIEDGSVEAIMHTNV